MENKTGAKKSKDKKLIRVLGNILFTIFMLVVISLIIITAQSKLTGREPRILGHRLYVVDSGSMSPTINVDSMIIVKESKPSEIKVQDVITYYGYDNQSRVTHRVVGIENEGEFFITQGDANKVSDPMPLEASKLIGKMVFKIPMIGKLFRFLNTQVGMAMLVISSILLMVEPVISRGFKRQTNM